MPLYCIAEMSTEVGTLTSESWPVLVRNPIAGSMNTNIPLVSELPVWTAILPMAPFTKTINRILRNNSFEFMISIFCVAKHV